MVSESDFKKLKQTLLQTSHFVLDEKWNDYNPMICHMQARFLCDQIPIDIMLPRDIHDEEIIKNRKEIQWLNMTLYVSSPEDTILQKIKIGRPRDFEDAASILKKQKTELNMKYLHQWAVTLDANDKLNWLLHTPLKI